MNIFKCVIVERGAKLPLNVFFVRVSCRTVALLYAPKIDPRYVLRDSV